MRKNILLVSFVSAFLLTQTACEDGKDEFLDDFSTILYFRNSGEIPVSVYNTGEDANYQVVINKGDRKSTRLNSSHKHRSRMPSSA